MTRVTRIQPDRVAAPQCSHPFNEAPYLEHYRRTRQRRILQLHPDWDPGLCGRSSSHIVEGRPLCSIHAGQAALAALLIEEERALARPSPYSGPSSSCDARPLPRRTSHD